MKQQSKLQGIFPTPVYTVKRESDDLDSKEIENIIHGGLQKGVGNSSTINSYIFNTNTKLKKLKEFCEEHIKIYVEQVINPKQELDFYITQSWLNVTKPGESHHGHFHANSIISGVFYISTEEDDKITFGGRMWRDKELFYFESKVGNAWNATNWDLFINNNELILFPSWLNHMVETNPKATTDRISISFNTFVKGALGEEYHLNKLII